MENNGNGEQWLGRQSDAVAHVGKNRLGEHVGQLDDATMFLIDTALRRVLGL